MLPKMKMYACGLTLGLVAVCLWLSSKSILSSSELKQLVWHSEVSETARYIQQEHKPGLILVTSPRCAACSRFKQVTLADPDVQRQLQNYVLGHFELSPTQASLSVAGADIAIQGTPTVLFFDPHAQLLAEPRIEGFVSPKSFLGLLKAAQSAQKN